MEKRINGTTKSRAIVILNRDMRYYSHMVTVYRRFLMNPSLDILAIGRCLSDPKGGKKIQRQRKDYETCVAGKMNDLMKKAKKK